MHFKQKFERNIKRRCLLFLQVGNLFYIEFSLISANTHLLQESLRIHGIDYLTLISYKIILN